MKMFARYVVFLNYSRADSDRVASLRDELRRPLTSMS
jgi:hypothetical protein